MTIATGLSGPNKLRAPNFVLKILDVDRGLAVEHAQGHNEDDSLIYTDEVDESICIEPVFPNTDERAGLNEDECGKAETPILRLFSDDPFGLYTIDLQARLQSGFTERSRSMVWMAPSLEAFEIVVLQHESALLPRSELTIPKQ